MPVIFCLLSFPDSNMLPSSLPILGWIFKWDLLAHGGRGLLNAKCTKLVVSKLPWADDTYLYRLTLFSKGLEFTKYCKLFFFSASLSPYRGR